MSVNKSVILVITLFSKVLMQVITDTVVYDYLKTVQLSPIGSPMDFPLMN